MHKHKHSCLFSRADTELLVFDVLNTNKYVWIQQTGEENLASLEILCSTIY